VKILAGIDFSEVSNQVVSKASEYALSFNAKLWLVHVAAPDPDYVGYDVGPKVIRDQRAGVLRKEHKELQQYANECNDKGVRCIPLLVQGSTLDTLLEVLNKLNVDLIVIGSHNNSSLYDFVVGSIKNELFHKAKTPILLVPKNMKESNGKKKK
jgi:nucleotide-binding universal stress UspA family protein